MPDNETYPLLPLPKPSIEDAPPGNPARPPNIVVPAAPQQGQRLGGRFRAVRDVFEGGRGDVREAPDGIGPEEVIVLEIIGSVEDFVNAVRKVPGMEWMAEVQQDEIAPDENFYIQDEDERTDRTLPSRLYLILSNQEAMRQLLRLWDSYVANPDQSFERGLNRFREVFRLLKDVRLWGVQDRLRESGMIEYWQDELRFQPGKPIRFEAELWYRENDSTRTAAFDRFRQAVTAEAGRIIHHCTIPEISFEGALLELPNTSVERFLQSTDTTLLRSGEVMFFRPFGQCIVPTPSEPPLDGQPRKEAESVVKREVPMVALLDGLPVENHSLLRDALVIDDPEEWAASYPASERHHGTAMASLIVNGELDGPPHPTTRPIYVRPVMKPERFHGNAVEATPNDLLAVDLIHRAVKRMFEGEGSTPPTAPHVKVINLSLGDRHYPFDRVLSAWARLLDWLSWKYNVLFIVSAGNHVGPIELQTERTAYAALDETRLRELTLKALARDIRKRRLLSPAEAINVLTVGALHTDTSTPGYTSNLRDPLSGATTISPVGAVGFGFRGAIKPEIVMPGGRILFHEKMGNTHTNATIEPFNGSHAPGQRVACPGLRPGDTNAVRYVRGTSNSAALVTRAAGQLLPLLETFSPGAGEAIPEEYFPVLLKAMLVHGASWGEEFQALSGALRDSQTDGQFRREAGRFIGYGRPQIERVFSCGAERGTLVGWGRIDDGKKHEFHVPLPLALSGKKVWRKATFTLAWFTPINPKNRFYRRAALNVQLGNDPLRLARSNCDANAVKRGTIQHEVFEGESATAFTDQETLIVNVLCRAEAGKLDESIPYALLVTEEVSVAAALPVYQEIRNQLRVSVRAT